MIVTTAMLVDQLSSYAKPQDKIARMVAAGELIPIRRGLYETDARTPAHCLAGSVYGPSYLSFEYVLGRHGLIPESVRAVTSATCGKRRSKRFDTPFGSFSYHDVPTSAFHLWINLVREDAYSYWIASSEKALCDQLYRISPIANLDELEQLLFQDLRIDEFAFAQLKHDVIAELASAYHCRNVEKLAAYMKRRKP